MTSFGELRHLLALIYIIPSLTLYLIIVYIIFFGKHKFSSSFYRLFGFSVINYTIHSVSYYILFRLINIPLFYSFIDSWPAESIFYLIGYAFSYYAFAVINFCNLAISFNRFTIFILKNSYNLFWERWLKWILLFCLITPIAFMWNLPFLGIQKTKTSDTVFYVGQTIYDFLPWWQPWQIIFYRLAIISLLSLIINSYVIYSFIKRKSNNNNSIQLSSQDSAAIIYTLLIFVTELFQCILQLLRIIDRDRFLELTLQTQIIVADVIDLGPAWFIFLTNKEIRKAVLNLIFQMYLKNRICNTAINNQATSTAVNII